jgi:homoserine dehydrogenase
MTTTTKLHPRPGDPARDSGSSPPPRATSRTVRVGLIGLGTIGRAFRDLLAERRDPPPHQGPRLVLDRVLVRDPGRRRGEASALATADPAEFLDGRYDAVVEATGSVASVEPVLRALLARGTPVVTANKALVAERGPALAALAASAGTELRFDASVAPGIPLFSLFERSLRSTRIRRIEAILNGTTNFVLGRLAAAAGGLTLADAITEAQLLGFAEPDPQDDLSGVDSARKLAILATVLGDDPLPLHAIRTSGIGSVVARDCALAAASGCRLKLIARADLDAARPRACVGLEPVPHGHPLASVENEKNGILLTADDGSELFLSGPGAGPRPTAAALLDDVLCAVGAPVRAFPFPSDVPLAVGEIA